MFNKILHSGINPQLDYYTKRRIRFVNLFALITAIGLLVGSSSLFFIGNDYPLLFEVFVLILSVLTIIFNQLKLHNLALYTFVFCINCAVFFISEYYDSSTGTYVFYFPLILCIALLHSPNEKMIFTCSYFTILLIFICVSVFIDFPGLKNQNISAENNSVLFLYNLLFCVVVTIILIVFVIRIFDSQSNKLIAALEAEKTIKEKIEASLKEKEIMLSEIHHRVKNNLSVVGSLLNLQIYNTNNEEAKQLLSDSRNRVLSMSLVHEKLYRKKDFSKIKFDKYIEELTNELLSSSSFKNKITLNKQLESCELPISIAIPLGLIINEIITNSIKHGFIANMVNPEITITLCCKKQQLELTIADNGKGFSFETSKTNDSTLGLSLIKSLCEQIEAKFDFSGQNGTQYHIILPLNF